MASDRLALAIPTYNRSEILLENLRGMLPELRQHQIPVFLSDDSTDGKTEPLIQALREEYPLIHYRAHQPSLGHDRNCLATLTMAEARHVWYLGDAMTPLPGTLTRLVALTQEDQDFIFLNSRMKKAWDSGFITKANLFDFLRAHVWHLTMTGATVYGSRCLERLRNNPAPRIYRNFQQLGLVLEHLLDSASGFERAYWLRLRSFGHNARKKGSYWEDRVFHVFARDWVDLIDAFTGNLDSNLREDILRSHGVHTGIFRWKRLVALRAKGLLTPAMLEEIGPDVFRAVPHPPWFLKAVAGMPVPLAKAYTAARANLRRLGRSR